MADPTPFAPGFDYSAYEASNPTSPKPGSDLDGDFANIQTTTDETIDALKDVRRSDGKLNNKIVTKDSLASDALALIAGGGSPRGNWATATSYSVKDLASEAGVTYMAVVAHTSSDFATDLAAGKWMVFSGGAESGTPYFEHFNGTGAAQTITLGQAFGTDELQIEVYVKDGSNFARVDPSDYTLDGDQLSGTFPSGTRTVLVFAPSTACASAVNEAVEAAATATAAATEASNSAETAGEAAAEAAAHLGSIIGIAALRALIPTTLANGARVTVFDYVANDGVPSRSYKLTNVDPGYADDGGYIIASDTTGFWWVLVPGDKIDCRAFGIKCDYVSDGSYTDNYAALKKLVAYVNTGAVREVFIPGAIGLSSAAWATGGSITITAPCAFVGDAPETSRFVVAGDTAVSDGVVVQNTSHVMFKRIGWRGNSAGGGGNGRFFLFHVTSAAETDMVGNGLEDCVVENFGNDNWFAWLTDADAGARHRHVFVRRNRFFSEDGNSFAPSNIGVSATVFSFHGRSNNYCSEIHFDQNYANGNYIKQFAVFWSYCSNVFVAPDNELVSFGQQGATDGVNAYALLAYDDLLDNTSAAHINVNLSGCIVSPRACGVYAATLGNVNVVGANITGQSDATVPGIPRGAISLNGCWGITANNVLTDNQFGIWAQGSDGKKSTIAGNIITSGAGGAYGIRIVSAIYGIDPYTTLPSILLADNHIDLTAGSSIGIRFSGNSAAPAGHIVVTGGRCAAGQQALLADDTGGGSGFVGGSVRLCGGAYFGGTCSASVLQLVDIAETRVTISGIEVDCGNVGGACNPIRLSDAKVVDIDGVDTHDFGGATGYAWSLSGARGAMRNVRRAGISRFVDPASDFGLSAPNWSADKGTFIQNLAEAASGGSATLGWGNDDGSTAWTTRTVTAA